MQAASRNKFILKENKRTNHKMKIILLKFVFIIKREKNLYNLSFNIVIIKC